MRVTFSCFLPGVACSLRNAGATSPSSASGRCRIRRMNGDRSMLDVLRKLLKDSDLPFNDFVELVLYHPEFGYYTRAESPVGKEGDYVTSPVLSPVFSYSLGNLCREFMSRSGDGVWQVVDIGCG